MMEKSNLITYVIISLLISLLVTACQPAPKKLEKNSMNQPPYSLHFGQQGFKDFAQHQLNRSESHPSGAGFKELDFTPPNLGKIKIENGENSLVIDHVFSVLGTSFNPDDGIQKLRINSGLNKEEFVTPEHAYQGYVELMKRINQAGWKVYIARYNPRIAKIDNIRYLMESGYVIDPSYIFSYEEWQKIISESVGNSIGYRLYANGILLNLDIDQTKKIEDGKEQYIVRYAFETARYNQRNLISDAYKMTPQELEQTFKQEVLRAKKSREMDEKEAIKNGYRIDQDYVDPDVWPFVK
ncbi:hypothetical protein OK024_16465 [Acinetobacter sp. UGAL515B_02]|uniref:hypothetical protein n=1 Tax=Acinetobacter soli TaxID=487316 RepID=UPI000E6AB23D|nr:MULTISPECIES: hypothetical protein [Acinetobacter]MBO3672567.1 hypothetical protein [Acinetobacter soli]MBU3120458.1 hypothetical protein [Acinetobacter soli]MBV6551664.1 hypothetical protein [Acinetobacter soli]MDS7693117.1 hypothetical protein [Acinetobacter soli]WON80255.1 hypothetical protein OK024_16465 [Acinetobacter sp. UGAL515B_02]